MKLDLLEIKGIYELKEKGTVETINRVFYEDGDVVEDVIAQMVAYQNLIKTSLEASNAAADANLG